MSILSVAQDISPFTGIDRPDALFASDVQAHVELAAIANRAADEISGMYEWQVLSKKGTFTGDGVKTAFDLPSDFSRFTTDSAGESNIVTPIMAGPMYRIADLDDWLYREIKDIGRVTYSWIMYGGQVHIEPALPNAVVASYFYQSKNIVSNGATTPTFKPAFNADGDVFRLDERLLMLCMLWMWRHSKGQTYAQYTAEFETRKSRLIAADKGPRSVSLGRSRIRDNLPVAYPFELS